MISKQALKNAVQGSLSALFVLGGVASVGWGVWQYSTPAAFIVVGALAIWIGLPDK